MQNPKIENETKSHPHYYSPSAAASRVTSFAAPQTGIAPCSSTPEGPKYSAPEASQVSTAASWNSVLQQQDSFSTEVEPILELDDEEVGAGNIRREPQVLHDEFGPPATDEDLDNDNHAGLLLLDLQDDEVKLEPLEWNRD